MATPPPGELHDAATWWDDPPLALRGGGLWSRPAGLLVGLIGVGLVALLVILCDRYLFPFPNASLPYLIVIGVVAYGWGGWAGAGTALAALLVVWFVHPLPRVALAAPGEWSRLTLLALSYGVTVLLGDAMRRLRRANDRLATIIASIADGILVVDRRGELIQTNEAMRAMLGADVPRSLLARNAQWQTRFADGRPMESGQGPTGRALRGLTTSGSELLVRNAAGQDLSVSVSAAPLRGRGGAILGAVIVCRDISEVRRLQQAKDDFLSVASHELKTPLTALGGYAQMLRQRLARLDVQDERAVRYLGALEAQTRRLSELVNSLLDVSRLDAGMFQLRRARCDLAALAREVADQLGDLSSRHEMIVEAPATLVGDWDRDRVEQVVVNLITNALRYAPDGGQIVVGVGTTDALPVEALPPDLPPGPAAFISVRDQGVGIPPDQVGAIFGRFHRTQAARSSRDTDARRGMGLGLFISREIVERHGGRIWAASPGLGQGATVTFTLPLDAAPVTDGVLRESAEGEPAGVGR